MNPLFVGLVLLQFSFVLGFDMSSVNQTRSQNWIQWVTHSREQFGDSFLMDVEHGWNSPIHFKYAVEISVVAYPKDYQRPWIVGRQRIRRGSGLILTRYRVLTNWHVAGDAEQVVIHQDGKQIQGKVIKESETLDLALIQLDEPVSSDGEVILRTDVPMKGEAVFAVGFPAGGPGMSITKGTVSRILFNTDDSLLRIQTDAAINPGNSGGPAIDRMGRVVGICVSKIASADFDNVGYLISIPVVEMFLDPQFDNVLYSLGIQTQKLFSPVMKKKYGLANTGIRVRRILPAVSNSVFQEDDILLEVNGQEVDHEGMIRFRDKERLEYTYLVQMKSKNGTTVKIKRNETVTEVQAPLSPLHEIVLTLNTSPRCIIISGLVFIPVSHPWKNKCAKTHSCGSWLHSKSFRFSDLDFVGHELIVLDSIFPDKANKGLIAVQKYLVDTVDGTKIKNLVHLKEVVQEAKGKFLVIGFEHGSEIALETKEIKVANQRVSDKYKCHDVL